MSLLRNVLIFHGGALGDFVLSFPLALALARLYPTSRVRYVCPAGKGRLAERALGVEWVDVESGFSGLYAEGAAVPDSVSRLVAGSHRIFSYSATPGDAFCRRARDIAPNAVITCLRTIPATPGVHALRGVCEQLAPDRAVGGALDQIVGMLGRQGLLRKPTGGGRGVVMHPGAGSPAKCWPVENFRELALRIRDEGDCGGEVHWVLGEVERERMPASERRALEAVGDVLVPGDPTGLLEEVLAGGVFVGNDSGPGHLAGMAGVPTVSVFTATDPAEWAPAGPAVVAVGGKGRIPSVNEVYAEVKRAAGAA